MQIDGKAEQPKNARVSITKSCEPDSNVTLESRESRAKHFAAILPTDDGIRMDESDKQLSNGCASSRVSFESDSKLTVKREGQK
jgi:hypothetical protein